MTALDKELLEIAERFSLDELTTFKSQNPDESEWIDDIILTISNLDRVPISNLVTESNELTVTNDNTGSALGSPAAHPIAFLGEASVSSPTGSARKLCSVLLTNANTPAITL